MPICDLCTSDEELDRLAMFRVLAVMVEPRNETARTQILTRIEKDTKINPDRRPRFSTDELWAFVRPRLHKGVIVGDLLLYLIQTKREFGRTSLNLALAIIRTATPRWEQPVGAEWHDKRHEGRLNQDRRTILGSFKRYQPVAHLWAAFVISETEKLPDFGPDSNETLPNFLALAEAIAKEAQGIYLQKSVRPGSRAKQAALPRASMWRFKLPPAAQRVLKLKVPRLLPAARAIALQYLG